MVDVERSLESKADLASRCVAAIQTRIPGSEAARIEPVDLELSPFYKRGGLGKALQRFGIDLNRILDELDRLLIA